jgi:hypothetical protein
MMVSTLIVAQRSLTDGHPGFSFASLQRSHPDLNWTQSFNCNSDSGSLDRHGTEIGLSCGDQQSYSRNLDFEPKSAVGAVLACRTLESPSWDTIEDAPRTVLFHKQTSAQFDKLGADK